MADETNGDRATVALVAAKIDGLKELLNSRLTGIERRLDDLSDLPVTVARLEGIVKAHELRVTVLEEKGKDDTEWRRGPVLLAAIAGISAVLNLLLAAGAIHVG